MPHNFNELIDASIKVLKELSLEYLISLVEEVLILVIIMMEKRWKN